MKTTKYKIEAFVMSICNPLGVTLTPEQWARVYNMMGTNRPLAFIIDKKLRRLELRPYPGHDLAHLFACTLNGHLRRGNVVLYSEHGLRPTLRVCSLATWADDYQAIVPPLYRGKTIQTNRVRKSTVTRKREVSIDGPMKPRDRYGKPTYYKAPSPENPYRRHPPLHGFQRTAFANDLMNRLGLIEMRP